MTPSSPRAQQHATRAAFFIPGFATAAWAPMVPYAKAKAQLSDASLGAVLLCLGLGSLLAMPLAGALSGRLGCRRLMIITTGLILLALPLLALAPSPLALGTALFLFGAGVGAMDCTMNMQAVAVERDAGRAMMSGFHAFYSIGGFIGAGCMTGLLLLGTPLWMAALLSVAAMLVVALLSAPHWRPQRIAHDGPMLAMPHGVVLFISVLAFIVFLAEGSMLDWSAVFLAEVRQVPRDQAGAGFAVFTLAMTAMRLFGDGLVERLGRTRTIIIGGVTAATGFALATLVPSFAVALAGYVMVGLGCANIVPALFSMAGQQRAMPESIAITAVTTLGYAGILAGPAAIGGLAHLTTLGFAFLCVAALLLGVAASARALARRLP
ncbi:MFS transporter [Stenotrophomonas sp. ESTM1D_MKCIP4_1]|uniref:MFS transporter n=1 Tax=Stenotrophomonas sp. ESTM1D_MKCIP4_1 TaxID=2072414 RepID=UPI000D53EBD8|nr:MFS transporter [Stenotrophomonas sp. ESTM1D_MKCIP4_1]AWH53065.1 MFS transporter [Stenotrophomonas sp. ESTM1D_MKCIP4_1]